MKKIISKAFLLTALITIFSIPQIAQADHGRFVFRRANFSNEFKLNTPEAINARGFAEIKSFYSKHYVKIKAHGLMPGETYVILNHWFEPIPERGVPDSPGALVDPSCNGHFQFLGKPVTADKKGRIKVRTKVKQLAPHIWIANFAKFLEVTQGGTQAPANADAFTSGGLLLPYADIVEREGEFIDTDPLTNCGLKQ